MHSAQVKAVIDRPGTVNPAMVILGRESRGLSQEALAERLAVTQGRVSKIEAGLLPVPEDLLENLSRALDYPRQFFLREGGAIGVGIAELFHRKRQNVPKKTLSKLHARIAIRLLEAPALLRSVEVSCSVPRMDIDAYNGRADDIAGLVRAGWRLPRGPVQDVVTTLEDAGIVVMPMDFGTLKVDAISRWLPGLPPFMFVNQVMPRDRCRYSLAHELGHLVMHDLANPEMELQANHFAAEFLLPEREVRADLRDLSLAKLALLKRYWRVSMSALLKRAEDLDVITPRRARSLWVEMSSAGYNRREPVELDPEGEQPSLLGELVETHITELGYNEADLGALVALNPNELWALYLQGQKLARPPLRALHVI